MEFLSNTSYGFTPTPFVDKRIAIRWFISWDFYRDTQGWRPFPASSDEYRDILALYGDGSCPSLIIISYFSEILCRSLPAVSGGVIWRNVTLSVREATCWAILRVTVFRELS